MSNTKTAQDGTTPQALAFYQQAQSTMLNLYQRWQDERAYENIDLYMMPLGRVADACSVVIKAMTKRPFGVKYAADGKLFHAFIRRSKYAYKRIG